MNVKNKIDLKIGAVFIFFLSFNFQLSTFNWRASSAFAVEMESSAYNAVFTSSTASLNSSAESSSFSLSNTVIGGNITEYDLTESEGYIISFSDLYSFDSAIASWERYQLSELLIKESRYGEIIMPGTWTKDNDPYFYWIIQLDPPTMISGYSFSIDQEPDEIIDTTESFFQFSDNALISGEHTFYVKPLSITNKWGEPLSVNILVDADAPNINSISPSIGELVGGGKVDISCFVRDDHSGVSTQSAVIDINGKTYTAEYNLSEKRLKLKDAVLEDGENIVTVTVYDMVGNVSNKSWTFISDGYSPSGAVVINNGDGATDNPYVTLKIDAHDEISGIDKMYLSFDGIFDSELSAPMPYMPLVEDYLLSTPDTSGIKTIYVMIRDKAGNLSDVFSDSIRLVAGYPDTRIISSPDSTTQYTDAEFIFESNKENVLFSYSLDGQIFSEWNRENKVSFYSMAQGNHIFKVRAALDLNGNGTIELAETDPSPAQWVWIISRDTRDDDSILEKLRKTLYFRRK